MGRQQIEILARSTARKTRGRREHDRCATIDHPAAGLTSFIERLLDFGWQRQISQCQ
jgi:hypothetical protein